MKLRIYFQQLWPEIKTTKKYMPQKTREEYLERQKYADLFFNDSGRNYKREFFLELIDKAYLQGVADETSSMLGVIDKKIGIAKGKKIIFSVEGLRDSINKLYTQEIKAHKDALGTEAVISKDDVLSVLFGDIPEKLR